MKHLKRFNETRSVSMQRRVDLVNDTMVDLFDNGFNIQVLVFYVFISKDYFIWSDVEDSIIKFINMSDCSGVSISLNYTKISDPLVVSIDDVISGQTEDIIKEDVFRKGIDYSEVYIEKIALKHNQ